MVRDQFVSLIFLEFLTCQQTNRSSSTHLLSAKSLLNRVLNIRPTSAYSEAAHSRAAVGTDWIFLDMLLIFSKNLSALPGKGKSRGGNTGKWPNMAKSSSNKISKQILVFKHFCIPNLGEGIPSIAPAFTCFC